MEKDIANPHIGFSLDEQSFKKLFESNFESICKFLNYYTKDQYLIEDVVQDIFVKLWMERDNLEIRHTKTYLFTSARNYMLNQIRNEHNRIQLLEKWATQEIEQAKGTPCIDREEFENILKQAIEKLPEKYKEIYIWSRNEKLTYSQISARKGISVKTVETQMGAASKQIREFIRKYYQGRKIDPSLLFLLILPFFNN